jgi:hypothetical protein
MGVLNIEAIDQKNISPWLPADIYGVTVGGHKNSKDWSLSSQYLRE